MVKIVGNETAFANPAARQGSDENGIPLSELLPGQSGVIVGLDTEAGLKMHLMELGFVAGSRITFLMPTPFGDPRIFSLRGTSIALRKTEAKCVRVKI